MQATPWIEDSLGWLLEYLWSVPSMEGRE
jgi:hypothetical protein